MNIEQDRTAACPIPAKVQPNGGSAAASPARAFMLRVGHISTPGRREQFTFAQDRVALGRAPASDVSLRSPLRLVSRAHAEICRDEGRFWLVDLGSRNATLLNGRALVAGRRYGLRCGDRFVLGDFMVEFVLAAGNGRPEGALW